MSKSVFVMYGEPQKYRSANLHVNSLITIIFVQFLDGRYNASGIYMYIIN